MFSAKGRNSRFFFCHSRNETIHASFKDCVTLKAAEYLRYVNIFFFLLWSLCVSVLDNTMAQGHSVSEK